MISEKDAVLNFIGNLYGQVKEIDNHIAATGSGAKFGNRSTEIKSIFEQVAHSPRVEQPAPTFIQPPPPPAETRQIQLAPVVQVAAPAATAPSQLSNDGQLEFAFKEDVNSILKDIYNLLFDIKKLIQAKQQTESTKVARRVKKYSDCCLCGSKPELIKNNDECILKCTGCSSQEAAATEQMVKIAWNNANTR